LIAPACAGAAFDADGNLCVRKAGGLGLTLDQALALTRGQICWLLDAGDDESPHAIEQRMMDGVFAVLDGLIERIGDLQGVPVSEIAALWPEPVDRGELGFWISEFLRCTTNNVTVAAQ
jgi:hypothetical protein